MSEADLAIAAIEKLRVPQGRLAGEYVRLGEYQRRFIRGALAKDVTVGVWSIGRGNAKSSTAAALAVTHALGMWGAQPQREIVIAARTREQAATTFDFARSFLESLDPELVNFESMTSRNHPLFALTIQAEDGPHKIKAISADGKSALGGGATLAILDERASWRPGRGDALEAAILTSLGKRDGRMLVVSTSAKNDVNAFSQWCDRPPSGCYVQEHRPPPGLPADDLESLLIANPGAVEGIGAPPDWLQRQAQQAMQRGGQALAEFRNLHRNERVAVDSGDVLVHIDDWKRCETADLPPRSGGCIVGLDFGGAASMTASAFYWPETKRLEAIGWFPSKPDLLARGHNDHVGDLYGLMAERGELRTVGERVVPARDWIRETIQHLDEPPICILADRYKQAEVGEALDAEGVGRLVKWRGFGWRDGAEDVRRFQREVLDGRIATSESVLLRMAISECALAIDEAGNEKLSKAKSTGRIDSIAAAVLAVAEGSRRRGRSAVPTWEPFTI